MPHSTSDNNLGTTLYLHSMVHTMRVYVDSERLADIRPARPKLDVSNNVRQGKPHDLDTSNGCRVTEVMQELVMPSIHTNRILILCARCCFLLPPALLPFRLF